MLTKQLLGRKTKLITAVPELEHVFFFCLETYSLCVFYNALAMSLGWLNMTSVLTFSVNRAEILIWSHVSVHLIMYIHSSLIPVAAFTNFLKSNICFLLLSVWIFFSCQFLILSAISRSQVVGRKTAAGNSFDQSTERNLF